MPQSERDPRTDPRPGDVLRRPRGSTLTVKSTTSRDGILYVDGMGWMKDCSHATWPNFVADCEVVTRGD